MKAISQSHCQCPECSSQYRIKQEIIGRKAKCKCGYVGVIPAPFVPTEAAANPTYELDLPEDPPPRRVVLPAASPLATSIPGFETLEEAGQAARWSRQASIAGFAVGVFASLAFGPMFILTEGAPLWAVYLILFINLSLVGVSVSLCVSATGASPWWRLLGLGWFFGLFALAFLPDRNIILRESKGDPETYHRLVRLWDKYKSVPWHRRGDSVILLLIAGAFLCGLTLIPACLIAVTGPVYHPPKAKHHALQPWHWGNRLVAYLLLVFWLLVCLQTCS